MALPYVLICIVTAFTLSNLPYAYNALKPYNKE